MDWRQVVREEAKKIEQADRWWRTYSQRKWAGVPFTRLPFDLQMFASQAPPGSAGSKSRVRGGDAPFTFAGIAGDQSTGWRRMAAQLHLAGSATLFAPIGLWALGTGMVLPDADISLLGIGQHRFFAFHSGLLVWGLDQLYRRYVQASGTEHGQAQSPGRRPIGLMQKALGVSLGAAAVGVGLHLMIDVFQPKSVVFPFFGSLVDGTLIDDGLWLLGNSIWCFRIAHDVFVLALGDDLNRVAAWVKSQFVRPLFDVHPASA